MAQPRLIDHLLTRVRIDLRPSSAPPSLVRLSAVTLLCVVVSLGVDAGLVRLGGAWFPTIRDYSHFHPYDYGTLTVIGVLAAGASWPVAIRISSAPRSLFFRVALAVTALLLVPDVWLLVGHEPVRGVLVLIAMHLSIALITYNLIIRLAPARSIIVHIQAGGERAATSRSRALTDEGIAKWDVARERVVRLVMMWAVALEFVTGLLCIVYVPISRPDGWIVNRGEALYLAHAIVGGLLALGVVAMLVRTSRLDRRTWICAIVGGGGVFLSAVGGLMCVEHPLRLSGMSLMFLGSTVAFFAYLTPSLASVPMPPPGWNATDGP